MKLFLLYQIVFWGFQEQKGMSYVVQRRGGGGGGGGWGGGGGGGGGLGVCTSLI
jgi:hypothetical protein